MLYLFSDLKTNRSHTFAFTFHSREEKQKLSGCYSKHGRRHHGKIQERLSRGAFRLGRGELFNLISPLASHSASPLLLYPLISSSLPAPLLTSSSQHPGARLCTVFTNTRTHARASETPPRGPWRLHLQTKAVSRSNPRVLMKSGRKGVIDEDGFGWNAAEKWDQGSRYSPTPPPLPQWWHHSGQRPFKLRLRLSAISSVWDWRIPRDFKLQKFFFVVLRVEKNENVSLCLHILLFASSLKTQLHDELIKMINL